MKYTALQHTHSKFIRPVSSYATLGGGAPICTAESGFAARHSFGVNCAALQVYQLAILTTSIVSVPTYHINQFSMG